jgi:queuine tRNA-ribosyltransferase
MVPILTTSAGSCLTAKNWQESGVPQGAFYLDALLMKPGINYLKALQSWPRYSGWEGAWVLNGSTLVAGVDDDYRLRSPFDGARIRCTQAEIMTVILSLAPQRVLLPQGLLADEVFLQQLAKTTRILIPATETTHYQNRLFHGVYYGCTSLQEVQALFAQPKTENFERYVYGPLSVDDWHTFTTISNQQDDFLESNMPAQEACLGMVYTQSGLLDITKTKCAQQFEPIEASCTCPTCTQQLTRAYLHHLFAHTPLLCQRFLIQHNWFVIQNGIFAG